MQTSGCEHTLEPMETYHFEEEQPLSFPPLSWSLNGGEDSAPIQDQQPREVRKRGGKRGPGIKLSTDPQSVSARERRHRISDRFRILKSLVPGGRKMDTVSMLEEAIHYVQFLKTQIVLHQAAMILPPDDAPYLPFPSSSCMCMDVGCPSSPHDHQAVSSVEMPRPLPLQTFSCSLPPAPPSPLPPFPGCSFFDGEEMMIPQYGFKY